MRNRFLTGDSGFYRPIPFREIVNSDFKKKEEKKNLKKSRAK